jgi:hypothetical protein
MTPGPRCDPGCVRLRGRRRHLHHAQLLVPRLGAIVDQIDLAQARDDRIDEQERVELLFHLVLRLRSRQSSGLPFSAARRLTRCRFRFLSDLFGG